MKTNITTALFDLDGVLIDSGKLIAGSFEHTLALFNTGKTFEDVADGGATTREVYEKITTEAELPKSWIKSRLHIRANWRTPCRDHRLRLWAALCLLGQWTCGHSVQVVGFRFVG